jgi:mannose-6-phosphate isomerase
MYKLKGKVQHYAWGGEDFIPTLLNGPNTDHQPFAEYWLGAHPNAPSILYLTDNSISKLPDIIRTDPKKYLGEKVAKQFGELPFLLKVLDVKDMLSIQVHPSKEEAEKGFEKENQRGISLEAPNRNYKDRNHKPEVLVALGDFWLLHGFLPKQKLELVLENNKEFNALLPVFESEDYLGLYKYVMELPQEEVDLILKPIASRLVPLYEKNQLSKMTPEFWAARVLDKNKPQYRNLDRGIFSIYFFNLVYLEKGQALFQGAGVPHAYLEGQNIELMSNSDNVLRGGLTPKYIDVPELLKHIQFEAIEPAVMNGESSGSQKTYRCPVPDFIVHKIELSPGEHFKSQATSVEILLLTKGSAALENKNKLFLGKGESAAIFAEESYVIKANEPVQIFRAAVPDF